MTLADVRGIIAAAVTAVTGLKCSTSIPDVIQPPCAILLLTRGDWDTNLPRNQPRRYFELIIALPSALSLEETLTTLDGYLETNQIKDAIEKASYSNKASYARVIGWRNYGETVIETYLGVRFDIMVI